MAKHWRGEYRRKDGTFVKGAWVKGKNPKSGCSFWLLGFFLAAVAIWLAG
ncbi:hypothetical protein [Streptomyces cucumeris]